MSSRCSHRSKADDDSSGLTRGITQLRRDQAEECGCTLHFGGLIPPANVLSASLTVCKAPSVPPEPGEVICRIASLIDTRRGAETADMKQLACRIEDRVVVISIDRDRPSRPGYRLITIGTLYPVVSLGRHLVHGTGINLFANFLEHVAIRSVAIENVEALIRRPSLQPRRLTRGAISPGTASCEPGSSQQGSPHASSP